jgi:hypothetical protein
VVFLALGHDAVTQASGFHQPLHRAAGDRPGVHTAGTAELRVDLAGDGAKSR